jgi:uncharacterized protein YyaL (SSP411 family)
MKVFLFLFIFFVTSLSANHLQNSSSPYLLQHQNNPVNWYPWEDKAFQKAKNENKLIFLSIGYSTCHWCHVMAKESFEDNEVANVLNKDFISIKVDREELPHIDGYYQKVYQHMHHKSGGWPLTIILTPDMEPFFSGTYIPKYEGYGSKGIIDILNESKKEDKKELYKKAKKIVTQIQTLNNKKISTKTYNSKLLKKSVEQFTSIYDNENKGFSIEPKFPEFAKIIMLLKIYTINNDKKALKMAIEPLKTMAYGGIYDQIEGGFYRYSVDKRWLLPHFEKMLYTNSEALEAYSLAYKITKEPLFERIIHQIIDEMDIRFKQNNIYKSASNAQSLNDEGEEEEGYYFMVEYESAIEYMLANEIDEKNAHDFLKYLGIVEDGTFDGDLSNPEITNNIKPKIYNKGIALLKQMRLKKIYPFIDNKINTAWNALHIKALLLASSIDKKYKIMALGSLNSLLDLIYIDDVLYHQTIDGQRPKQKALLEDYAFVTSVLFEAYQTTLDKKYFTLLKKLIKKSISLFYKNGKWIESNDTFITYADINDKGYASPLGVHFNNLILYATMQSDMKIFKIVEDSMQYFVNEINQKPINSPNATMASIYFQIEPVILKSSQQNLENIDNTLFTYPFVYKKVEQTNQYLACKLNTCFSYSKDINKVIKDINLLY